MIQSPGAKSFNFFLDVKAKDEQVKSVIKSLTCVVLKGTLFPIPFLKSALCINITHPDHTGAFNAH